VVTGEEETNNQTANQLAAPTGASAATGDLKSHE